MGPQPWNHLRPDRGPCHGNAVASESSRIYNGTMSISQINSATLGDETLPPPLLPELLLTFNRAEAMGLATRDDDLRPTPQEIDRLLQALRHEKLARNSVRILEATRDQPPPLDEATLQRLRHALRSLRETLRHNPLPQREWPALQRHFDPEHLARLLGISKSSVLRYARGERHTPDDVAARLHWLAIVVGYLVGSYNALGIRRWFARPRRTLDGASPEALLLGERPWSPDGDSARRIEELARASTGMTVT